MIGKKVIITGSPSWEYTGKSGIVVDYTYANDIKFYNVLLDEPIGTTVGVTLHPDNMILGNNTTTVGESKPCSWSYVDKSI